MNEQEAKVCVHLHSHHLLAAPLVFRIQLFRANYDPCLLVVVLQLALYAESFWSFVDKDKIGGLRRHNVDALTCDCQNQWSVLFLFKSQSVPAAIIFFLSKCSQWDKSSAEIARNS